MIDGSGDVEYHHGQISNVYHMPRLSENMFSIAQLTQTKKTVKFWLNRFIIKDFMLGGVTIYSRYPYTKDRLYKFCDSPKSTGSMKLIAQTNVVKSNFA